MDGEFDDQCDNFHTTPATFNPPFPPIGQFVGRACTETQDEHNDIKSAIESILALQTLNMDDQDAYEGIVEGIIDALTEDCEDYLHGGSGFDDIHLGLAGDQACTPGTAGDLCDEFVVGPANDALLELMGGGDEQPQMAGDRGEDGRKLGGLRLRAGVWGGNWRLR